MDRLTWVKNLIQLSELEVGVNHAYRIADHHSNLHEPPLR